MKRIRVAPGKFVTISTDLAEKAARVFGAGLTREQVLALSATEPKGTAGLMTGSPKPLAIAQLRVPVKSVEARSELTQGARSILTHP